MTRRGQIVQEGVLTVPAPWVTAPSELPSDPDGTRRSVAGGRLACVPADTGGGIAFRISLCLC